MPVARHGMICVRRASVLAPSAGSFTGASGCRATLSWASAAGPELACAEGIVSSLNCEFTLPPWTGAQLLFKDRPQVVKLILDARPERRHSSLTPFRAEQQSHLLGISVFNLQGSTINVRFRGKADIPPISFDVCY